MATERIRNALLTFVSRRTAGLRGSVGSTGGCCRTSVFPVAKSPLKTFSHPVPSQSHPR
jgi:hypothetical protein